MWDTTMIKTGDNYNQNINYGDVIVNEFCTNLY